MEALTPDYLNTIDTEKNLNDFLNQKHKEELERCVSEINEILLKRWHLRSEDFLYCNWETPVWGQAVFNDAKLLFLANGIELAYYQPHRQFSFREVKCSKNETA
jgi:hypothetical protein